MLADRDCELISVKVSHMQQIANHNLVSTVPQLRWHLDWMLDLLGLLRILKDGNTWSIYLT